jgi:hypothetical protein
VNPALDPSSCRLDDLSMADYIDMLVRLSEHIPFYNHEGQEQGNWKKLILQNETILLYYLSAINTDKITDGFYKIFYNTKTEFYPHKKELLIRSLIQYLVTQLTNINDWYLTAGIITRNTSLLEEFQSIADTKLLGVAADTQLLAHRYPNSAEQETTAHDKWYIHLADIWKHDVTGPSANSGSHKWDITTTKSLYNKISEALYRLRQFAIDHIDLTIITTIF